MPAVFCRRVFLGGLAFCILGSVRTSDAQGDPTGKLPLVGLLHTGSIAAGSEAVRSFRKGLHDLGYVEGQNVDVQYRAANGNLERLPALAAELLGLKAQVLVAIGPAAVRASRETAGDTAIVAVDMETDPVQNGFAASFGHPGGNITGLFADLPDLAGKWLQLLREAAPAITRVVVVWDPNTGSSQLNAVKIAAQTMALEIHVVEVKRPGHYDDAFKAFVKARSTGVVQLSSPVLLGDSKRFAAFTLQNRLPAIAMLVPFAEAGGLLAYGPSAPQYYPRIAVFVDKLLKGSKPGDLPLEQPTKFELAVNVKTARSLGLTIPQPLLLRADRVIQ
jgi:putative ABC transport system substrate-binding protein